MTTVLPQFRFPTRHISKTASIVVADPLRITVITPRLIRIEYSKSGKYIDQPSQVFWHRDQQTPDFEIHHDNERLVIETEELLLNAVPHLGLTSESLQILIKSNGVIWHVGDENPENLKGTARTLDLRDGPLELEPGLLSRSGWTLVDDSHSLLFNDDGWLKMRPNDSSTVDWYFFGYGSAYQECLNDFFLVSSPVPLVPRWALGNWWSRYWAYSQAELGSLMLDFKAHQIPLSVCIIDMDWHITETGNQCSGWTGYTWNRDLFPDPQGFIDFIHELGLKTALNLHPAEGIHPHEEQYFALAETLGIDPESGIPITYDPTNPDFFKPYLEYLHHPQEDMGIDFWWMDWQQGNPTRLKGLNLLWWINHLHFLDLGRTIKKRPFIFSRWGGLGNHRYPIGFSGDAYVSWKSLGFQPYFTATAANVGYSWWSHDIGGHMMGIEEPELYLRWLQFGVFSPIMRLHSTSNEFHERRPWGYDAEIERIASGAMRFRHRLIPYIYSTAWRNTREGKALIRPVYHVAPQAEDAYACTETYTFGSQLIAAPFVEPSDNDTRLSRQVIWLPQGDWFDFDSGDYLAGGYWHAVYGNLAKIPVFAKAGAIVPLGPEVGWGGLENPDFLELRIFPCEDGSFELYEDDGESQRYLTGNFACTEFKLQWRKSKCSFQILPASGDLSVLPGKREYQLLFLAAFKPDKVEVIINGSSMSVDWNYDSKLHMLKISGILLQPVDYCEINMVIPENEVHNTSRRLILLKQMVADFRMETEAKRTISHQLEDILKNPNLLEQVAVSLTISQLRALSEVICNCGVHESDHSGERIWIAWNNAADPNFSYNLTQEHLGTWRPRDRYTGQSRIVPKSLILHPSENQFDNCKFKVGYDRLYELGFVQLAKQRN